MLVSGDEQSLSGGALPPTRCEKLHTRTVTLFMPVIEVLGVLPVKTILSREKAMCLMHLQRGKKAGKIRGATEAPHRLGTGHKAAVPRAPSLQGARGPVSPSCSG